MKNTRHEAFELNVGNILSALSSFRKALSYTLEYIEELKGPCPKDMRADRDFEMLDSMILREKCLAQITILEIQCEVYLRNVFARRHK